MSRAKFHLAPWRIAMRGLLRLFNPKASPPADSQQMQALWTLPPRSGIARRVVMACDLTFRGSAGAPIDGDRPSSAPLASRGARPMDRPYALSDTKRILVARGL